MPFCALWAAFGVRIRLFDSFKDSVIRSWGFFDLFKVPMIRYSGFVDSFEVPIIHSWGFFESFEVLMIRSWGLFYLLKVRANARDYWTICMIRLKDPIFRFPCPNICTLWLDCLEDILFRVLSSSLSDDLHAIHRPILPDQYLIRQSSHDSSSDITPDCFLLIL